MTITTVFPCLRISSRATLDFYERAFGAEIVAAYPDSGDVVHHAELRLGAAGIMCGTEAGGLDQPAGGTSTYWVVASDADVDALHARALAEGASEILAPHDPDYGGRQCSLRDPDGNAWSFGSYRGEAAD